MIGIVFSLNLVSCSNESEVDSSSADNKIIKLAPYEKIVYENKDALFDWAYAVLEHEENASRASECQVEECYAELKNELLPSAIDFASDLEITKEDFELMTGVSITNEDEYEEALVGLMLFVTVADCSMTVENSVSRGGTFGDCFIEATGIAAGVAIVGHLTKGAVTKALVNAIVKLVAKVGLRTLNGVGLALIAAEIAWCMW